MWLRVEEQREIEERLDEIADKHICECGHSAKHHYTGYFGDSVADLGNIVANASEKHCMYWDCGKMKLCNCQSFKREMVSLCYFPKDR